MRSIGIYLNINQEYKYRMHNSIDSLSEHFTNQITKLLDDFHLFEMKSTSTPTIVFAFTVTIWAYVAVGEVANFSELLERIENQIRINAITFLPFHLTLDEITKLNNTSNEFKADFVANHYEKGNKPILALYKAIEERFTDYIRNLDNIESIMLSEIYPVDPIGFLAYLNEKNASSSSDVAVHIGEFYRMITEPSPPLLYNVIDIESTSSGGTNLKCPICLECPTSETPEVWVAPKCGHAFHQECIQKWIDVCEGTAPCPCCRSPVRG